MSEQTFYQNGNVSITNTRFMVGTTTYAMHGVTSVKRRQVNPPKGGSIILGIIGIVMLLACPAIVLKLAGVVAIIIAVIWYRSIKSVHIVLLNSASGETQALSSTDNIYINEVITALNQAIIYRG